MAKSTKSLGPPPGLARPATRSTPAPKSAVGPPPGLERKPAAWTTASVAPSDSAASSSGGSSSLSPPPPPGLSARTAPTPSQSSSAAISSPPPGLSWPTPLQSKEAPDKGTEKPSSTPGLGAWNQPLTRAIVPTATSTASSVYRPPAARGQTSVARHDVRSNSKPYYSDPSLYRPPWARTQSGVDSPSKNRQVDDDDPDLLQWTMPPMPTPPPALAPTASASRGDQRKDAKLSKGMSSDSPPVPTPEERSGAASPDISTMWSDSTSDVLSADSTNATTVPAQDTWDISERDKPPHLIDANDGALVRRPSPPSRSSTTATKSFKIRARPACILKLMDVPRYAKVDDVKNAVAAVLHDDSHAGGNPRPEVGRTNFDVMMEERYSSAQNFGCAYVILPYAFFGLRLQERGIIMPDIDVESEPKPLKRLRIFPELNFEPTPQKRLLLQKTHYQDPKIAQEFKRKRDSLTSFRMQLQKVELGSFLRDTSKTPSGSRVFSAEWAKEFRDQPCHLTFEGNMQALRVSYGGHADRMRNSIVVKFTSVKEIITGTDFFMTFLVFVLEWCPAFEEEDNVIRHLDGPKKDVEDIRKRLVRLDDKHVHSAPYAFSLKVVLLEHADLPRFVAKAREAGLQTPESTATMLPKESQAAFKRRQIDFEYRALCTEKVLDRFKRWMKDIDYVLAFQLEAMVRNVVVDHKMLLDLRKDIEAALKDMESSSLKSDVIRQWCQIIKETVNARGVVFSGRKELLALLNRAKDENGKLVHKLRKKPSPHGVTWLGKELLPRIFDSSAFLCHHATITPTAVHLEGPFPVLSNRVLRKYPEHNHCFLRVHFTDEEHHQFRWEREVDGHHFVRTRVGGILKDGFDLAGRRFEFLAYSFGALKEHTVWFVTPFEMDVSVDGLSMKVWVNAEAIRQGLGDFSSVINTPSLYGARLSQAFSATYPSVKILADEISQIKDIRCNGTHLPDEKRKILSDGCAPCSTELAQDIDKVLMRGKTRPSDQQPPPAYQIRIGGSKGMIYIDPTLEGRKLCLRPSMNKFDAPDSLDIEVANVPRASAMYLNRPLVMVLEDLGVRLSTFMTLQQDTMQNTLDSTKDIHRFRYLLSQLKLGARFQLHYVLGKLADMLLGFRHNCGGDGEGDPALLDDYWFYNMIQTSAWVVFRQIKYQARIMVPSSWTLVGVLDEHGLLQPGEVMVHIVDEGHANGYFLKGKILICRSPVVHPGDVQMVTAVVPPDGHPLDRQRLTNCVVMSANGARSIASCLGGGDLDGDLFHVSEYKDIYVDNPYRPADYIATERVRLDRDCDINDVADFVVEYINSDVLGLVSTTHLIIADQNRDGVRCKKCMDLADLHSKAVDYAKTGVAVPRGSIPHFDFSAKPDWKADEVADSSAGDFYPSTRALGHLYRRVQAADINELEIPRPTRTASAVEAVITQALVEYRLCEIEDFDVEAPAPPDIVQQIEVTYEFYRFELDRMAKLHALHENKPLTEMEVMMGTITQKSEQPKKRKELASRMHIHTSQIVGAVMQRLLPQEDESELAALQRVWHTWNWVTARPFEQYHEDQTPPIREEDKKKEFGARSFGMLVLVAIFQLHDELLKKEPMDIGNGDSALGPAMGMAEDFEVADM